jgi:hypothetical protein
MRNISCTGFIRDNVYSLQWRIVWVLAMSQLGQKFFWLFDEIGDKYAPSKDLCLETRVLFVLA